MKFNFPVTSVAPDGIELLILPKSFGKRRAVIRLVRVHTDQPNGALGINFADATSSGIRRHPATNDEVFIVWHRLIAHSVPTLFFFSFPACAIVFNWLIGPLEGNHNATLSKPIKIRYGLSNHRPSNGERNKFPPGNQANTL